MKTKKMTFGLLGISSVFLFSTMRVQAADSQEMYRLYNPNSGEHFYTKSTSEKDNLVRVGWKFEGIAWQAPTSGTDVYRLYNPNNGDHHYTTSLLEKNNLVNVGWRFEGTGWYSDKNKAVPIYRVYNPNTKGAGSHHYTKDLNEYNRLATIGWRQENIGWYGANPSTETTYTITIKCVDEQNKVIKQSVVNSVKKGSSRSFDAEQIVGYELTSEKKINVNNIQKDETITFKYKKKKDIQTFQITTKYRDEKQKEVAPKSVSTVEAGSNYTAQAISINGYTLSDQNTKTITNIQNNQTLTFIYVKDIITVLEEISFTEKYIDISNNTTISPNSQVSLRVISTQDPITGEKVTDQNMLAQSADEYVKKNAPKTINGYQYVSSDFDIKDKTIKRRYKKQESTTNPTNPTDPVNPTNPTNPSSGYKYTDWGQIDRNVIYQSTQKILSEMPTQSSKMEYSQYQSINDILGGKGGDQFNLTGSKNILNASLDYQNRVREVNRRYSQRMINNINKLRSDLSIRQLSLLNVNNQSLNNALINHSIDEYVANTHTTKTDANMNIINSHATWKAENFLMVNISSSNLYEISPEYIADEFFRLILKENNAFLSNPNSVDAGHLKNILNNSTQYYGSLYVDNITTQKGPGGIFGNKEITRVKNSATDLFFK